MKRDSDAEDGDEVGLDLLAPQVLSDRDLERSLQDPPERNKLDPRGKEEPAPAGVADRSTVETRPGGPGAVQLQHTVELKKPGAEAIGPEAVPVGDVVPGPVPGLATVATRPESVESIGIELVPVCGPGANGAHDRVEGLVPEPIGSCGKLNPCEESHSARGERRVVVHVEHLSREERNVPERWVRVSSARRRIGLPVEEDRDSREQAEPRGQPEDEGLWSDHGPNLPIERAWIISRSRPLELGTRDPLAFGYGERDVRVDPLGPREGWDQHG